MYKIIYIFSYCFIVFSTLNCKGQNLTKKFDSTINFSINYSVVNQKEIEIKQVLSFWKKFLNSDKFCYNTSLEWDSSYNVRHPSFIFCFLDNLKNSSPKLQVSVLSVNKMDDSVYKLKTIINHYQDSTNFIMTDYIFDSYIRHSSNGFKVISALEWNMNALNKKQFKNIEYFYEPNSHTFNKKEALKMLNFSKLMSQKFSLPEIPFSYIITSNTIDAYKTLGFDFISEQFTPNQSYTGFTDPVGRIIFSGNNSEYYPHEVVHLYIQNYVEKEEILHRHIWFEEGIATLFGGSRGFSLSWHIKELKDYLTKHSQENINDVSKLSRVPNGKFMTSYPYAIGGLICKLVYEKKGMNGLFELLKSGGTDDDFYKAIENNFNIKKQDFGTFIRTEISKT